MIPDAGLGTRLLSVTKEQRKGDAASLLKGEEQALRLVASKSCFVSRGENYFDIF